jgi:hypothetical protein
VTEKKAPTSWPRPRVSTAMSRIFLLLLASFVAAACSSTTVISPGTSPSADGGGGGGPPAASGDHGCSKACAAYMKPACPSQTLDDCLGTCNAAAARCPAEADATNACIPSTSVSCASDGLAVSDGCDAEFNALSACYDGARDAGTTTPTCTPHRAAANDGANCTGGCPQPAYIATGGSQYVWCTVRCTTDATCDAASGKPGVFACDGAVCRGKCRTNDDCFRLSGATGCAVGFCF